MQTQSQNNLALDWHSSTPAQNLSPSTEAVMVEERISEVILPSLGFSMAALVAPMLTQLSRSHNPRWLTLICTTAQAHDISRWLRTTGVVINKLLLLTADDDSGCLQLGGKVLATGNSHTVVSWINNLSPTDLQQLESAAHYGNCAGVIIRQRQG